MSKPIVAIVGRPNVGKSTLVNRIAQSNEAIVDELSGVTRDRSYHDAEWNGCEFVLVDTGGIEISNSDQFQKSIRSQALIASKEADVVVFLVDGHTGLTSDDEAIAHILHKSQIPILLAVNKMDNPDNENAIWEFLNLGIGNPWPISAIHGHGTGDLLDEIINLVPQELIDKSLQDEEKIVYSQSIKVAIVGRPNAGKSSLTNKLLSSDRSIVSDLAGTTRDAIDTTIVHENKIYTIIDTAGLRKQSAIDKDIEYYGFVRALRAMDRANIVLLVIDGTIGLTDQDQRIANMALDRGCGMVVILNKWDIVEGSQAKLELRQLIKDRLTFIGFAQVIAISALSGKHVQRIWGAIDNAYASYTRSISTAKLNNWLQDLRDFGHTISKGKKILKLKYVTQTRKCPPQFTFFCNHPEMVTNSYRRFLENRLRKNFDLEGTPIRLQFKKSSD